jgi:adenylyltransferase/sulfurtransferase
MELSRYEVQRYLRQIRLDEVGLTGQQRLKAASVLIVGGGGLGCAVLASLAAAGIGRLGVVDHDRVALSNLHRQLLYREADIGQLKVDALQRQFPTLEVYPHPIQQAPHLLNDYDLVIDATDNLEARLCISESISRPWIYGAIHRFEGHVAILDHYLFPDAQPTSTCAEGGVLGPLPQIIGSIQAMEAIKFITGIQPSLLNRLLVLNVLTWQLRVFSLDGVSETSSPAPQPRAPSCPVLNKR